MASRASRGTAVREEAGERRVERLAIRAVDAQLAHRRVGVRGVVPGPREK